MQTEEPPTGERLFLFDLQAGMESLLTSQFQEEETR